MGTYKIIPTAIDSSTWTVTSGTALGVVQPGTPTSSIIKTNGGAAALRANFSGGTGLSYFLDGSGTGIAFSSLPAGFQPTSATAHYEGTDANGDLSALTTLRVEFDAGTANTTVGDYDYPGLVPGSPGNALLYLGGIGLRGTGNGASDLLWGTTANGGLYITGSYVIGTWWFKSSTNHYKLSQSSPGAGWATASPNPTPTITAVKRYSTYVDGVADGTLISPAYGCAGTTITIQGSGFGDGAVVLVGGNLATSVTVVDQTTITCVVPSHADGLVDVTVYNDDGVSTTDTNAFQYETPWWKATLTYIINGITTTYYAYFQSCSAPSSGTWVIQSSAPDFTTDPNGWYVSPSAFGGDVIVVSDASPADPRTWADIATWAGSSRSMLGGSPAASCTLKNRLVYPATGYTVGTDDPPIHVFDGTFDRLLCRVPKSSGTPAQAVLSMLAANGTIYLSTFDSGTSSSDWAGRVFSLDLDSGTLTPIGAAFSSGEMPYALAWHMGRLWCGTNNGIGTAGKVYYFRPGIDTSWTQDYDTTTSSVGGVDALVSYKGLLYVGTAAAAGTFAKVLARDSTGAYTTSDTGTGGTAKLNNGFLAFREFGGNLYASYWNNDTTAIAKIRKFNNSAWSTAYTGSSGTLRPYIVLFVDDGTLFAVAGTSSGLALTGVLLSTTDGSSWTNLTSELPESTRTFLPMMNVEVL